MISEINSIILSYTIITIVMIVAVMICFISFLKYKLKLDKEPAFARTSPQLLTKSRNSIATFKQKNTL